MKAWLIQAGRSSNRRFTGNNKKTSLQSVSSVRSRCMEPRWFDTCAQQRIWEATLLFSPVVYYWAATLTPEPSQPVTVFVHRQSCRRSPTVSVAFRFCLIVRPFCPRVRFFFLKKRKNNVRTTNDDKLTVRFIEWNASCGVASLTFLRFNPVFSQTLIIIIIIIIIIIKQDILYCCWTHINIDDERFSRWAWRVFYTCYDRVIIVLFALFSSSSFCRQNIFFSFFVSTVDNVWCCLPFTIDR